MIHKQKHSTITRKDGIEIDENIFKLVEWLNTLDGIETRESCHGDKKIIAYVSFHSTNNKNLAHIMNLQMDFRKQEITYLESGTPVPDNSMAIDVEPDGADNVIYVARFRSEETLESFAEFVFEQDAHNAK